MCLATTPTSVSLQPADRVQHVQSSSPLASAKQTLPDRTATAVDTNGGGGRGAEVGVGKCSCEGILPASHVKVPCLCIPSCSTGTVAEVTSFTAIHQQGGGAVTPAPHVAPRKATICHDVEGLLLKWSITDPHIQSALCGPGHNQTCNQCRDQVWQGDAAEFYMSETLGDTEQNVTEIDVSPVQGGLWASFINNPSGYFPDSNVPIDCASIKQSTMATRNGTSTTPTAIIVFIVFFFFW